MPILPWKYGAVRKKTVRVFLETRGNWQTSVVKRRRAYQIDWIPHQNTSFSGRERRKERLKSRTVGQRNLCASKAKSVRDWAI